MSIILGYFFLFVNIVVVIMMTTDKLKIYLDFHSFLCVVGGTLLSGIVGYGGKAVMQLVKIYTASIKKKHARIDIIVNEVVKISKETKGDINQSFLASYKTDFFFLRDGLALIADGFSKDQIEAIMEERIDSAEDRYKQDEKMIQSLAKIPPSFGLVGTTVGLIALFAEVGGSDALKKIGPALAVALTATLYGVLLAFVVLNPMLDRVKLISHHDIHERRVILKGIMLLKSKASPMFIEELLKSHLTFGRQQNLKPAAGGKAA